MTITVGDTIANGNITVVEVDTDNLIVKVEITYLRDPATQQVPTITIVPHMTVDAVENLLFPNGVP